MRGKEYYTEFILTKNRITPAYAGKSFVLNFGDFRHRDHPRLCGEKWRGFFVKSFYDGSPPPMRGKVLGCGIGNAKERITPAYAGKRL